MRMISLNDVTRKIFAHYIVVLLPVVAEFLRQSNFPNKCEITNDLIIKNCPCLGMFKVIEIPELKSEFTRNCTNIYCILNGRNRTNLLTPTSLWLRLLIQVQCAHVWVAPPGPHLSYIDLKPSWSTLYSKAPDSSFVFLRVYQWRISIIQPSLNPGLPKGRRMLPRLCMPLVQANLTWLVKVTHISASLTASSFWWASGTSDYPMEKTFRRCSSEFKTVYCFLPRMSGTTGCPSGEHFGCHESVVLPCSHGRWWCGGSTRLPVGKPGFTPSVRWWLRATDELGWEQFDSGASLFEVDQVICELWVVCKRTSNIHC